MTKDIHIIVEDIEKRELNLEKIFKLPETDKQIVLGLYSDLCDSIYGEKGMNLPGGVKIDYMRAMVSYNTLINNDYLVTKREANLDKILS